MRVLSLFALALAAGGCLGDLVPLQQSQNQGSQTDGGAPDLSPAGNPNPNPTPAADMATAAGDLAPACINQTAALTDGHHNPGLNCMTCHNNAQPTIPQFTVAGTLYSALTGGTAVAGATVEVTDATGAVYPLLTGTNGNFYSEQPIVFPVNVRATACPADLFMPTSPTVGACNSCHDATQQVHVP
jgi:hypothetical protein